METLIINITKKGNKLQSLQAAVGRLTSEGVSLQQDDIYLEEKVCAEFIKAVSRFFEEIYLQIERKVKAKNAPKSKKGVEREDCF
ncbi:hypothetical protein ACT7DE_29915 [Bacillus paranthracis]